MFFHGLFLHERGSALQLCCTRFFNCLPVGHPSKISSTTPNRPFALSELLHPSRLSSKRVSAIRMTQENHHFVERGNVEV